MPEVFGQMTAFGRTIAATRLEIQGFGEVDYSVPDGEDPTLEDGDHIRIMVEFGVEKVGVGAKLNKQLIGTRERAMTAKVRPLVPQCVEVDQILRKADIDRLWEQAHGATG